MALPQAKQDLTDQVLAQASPFAAGWAKIAQDAARSRVAAMGVPVRRDEYWKFTNPAPFVEPKAQIIRSSDPQTFDDANALTVVFEDGVFKADKSDDLVLAGLTIERLAESAAADLHWAKSLYGTLEARSNEAERKAGAALFKSVPRPMAALNSAMASDGLLIHVTDQVDRPIRIKYRAGAGQAVLHHVIRVEAGASLTLLEEGIAGAAANTMIEVDVADGGAFHHIRLQGPEADHASLTNLFARLGEESTFKSFGLTANGAATRNEAVIELTGDNATAHIAGAALGDGNFHHDDTVYVTHDAAHCESRQVYKKVLKNGAVGVFQGKILVQPDAQKTDGYQISQSLLLDDDSQFLAKPELEIYADDVACSHGSTSGAIDETALFYLRSRGVPLAEAQALLTLAFLAEALDEIEDETLAAMVGDTLEAWLRG